MRTKKPDSLTTDAKLYKRRPFLVRIKRGDAALKKLVGEFIPIQSARKLQGKVFWALYVGQFVGLLEQPKIYPEYWHIPVGAFTKVKQ